MCTNYNIALYDDNLKSCLEELYLMEKLRNVEQSSFLENNQSCYDLYKTIKFDAFTAFVDRYTVDEKELLKKSISVAFYIYQEQAKNSHFKYDNWNEFLDMKCKLYGSNFSDDDIRVQTINDIFSGIEKNSIWYQEDTNVVSKYENSDDINVFRKK